MNGYSMGDTIKIVVNLVYTKLFWKGARLVRFPFLARNRRNIVIGKGFTCGSNCRMNPSNFGKLVVGKNFTMGDQCQIEAMKEVIIGDDVLLASKVYIGDSSHGSYGGNNQSSPNEPPNNRQIVSKSIHIGDNVWIGNAATILEGVEIGSGSIIGANAVVTSDIPSNCIAVGSPAKIIKRYDDEKKVWSME